MSSLVLKLMTEDENRCFVVTSKFERRRHFIFYIFYFDFISRCTCLSCFVRLSLGEQFVCSVFTDGFCSSCLVALSRVMTYREHGAWVVKAHLQKETDGHIISVR